MKTPLASIIIPAFNAEHYVRSAIESAIVQTHPAVEVVLVDDGSTDATEHIMKKYQSHPRVRMFSEPNKGLAAARNAGIRISRGEYVCFLDADDMYLPHKVARQVATLEEYSDYGVCYSDLFHFSDAEPPTYYHHRYTYPSGDVFRDLLEKQLINPVTVMARREVFDQFGTFNETYACAEDWDLWLRWAWANVKFCFLNEKLALYRIRTHGNLTAAQNEPRLKENVNHYFRELGNHLTKREQNEFKFPKILRQLRRKLFFAYLMAGEKDNAWNVASGEMRRWRILVNVLPTSLWKLTLLQFRALKHRLLLKKLRTPPISSTVKAMKSNRPLRLHLGCQEKYLKGYVNIDLPPREHTAQTVKADMFADVQELRFDEGTVDEIRSHHLLEHFSRHEALVLLARWHRSLRVGGMLIIETPDFEASFRKFLEAGDEEKFIFARHIFGSQEAGWAYHKDFWSEEKYVYVLGRLGFGEFRFEKFDNNAEQKIPVVKRLRSAALRKIAGHLSPFGFNNLPNIVCHAKKVRDDIPYHDAIQEILKKSLVGRERSGKILGVWMAEVDKMLGTVA